MSRLLSLFLLTAVFVSCKTVMVNLVSKRFDKHKNEKFPDLSLVDTAGRPTSLAVHYGKTVYVDMWFVGCIHCANEFRSSRALKERFRKDTSLVFVNICFVPPPGREAWLREIDRLHATGYNYYVPDSATYKRIEQYIDEVAGDGAPTFHLLDKEGRYLGWNVLEPSNSPMVDYVIHKATAGVPAKKSFRRFVRYFSKKKRENEEMNQWFTRHFGMEFHEYLIRMAAKDSGVQAQRDAGGQMKKPV